MTSFFGDKMKNSLIILIFLCILNSMSALTREVSLDGTKPYTSIQSAIDSALEGDTIQVYPGTYRENVSIEYKIISIQSLYATTNDTTYIHNTQIIGAHTFSAVYITEQASVTLNGFTIMNNENHVEQFVNWPGGGIFVFRAHAVIKNNIITNSIAGNGGGGICVSGFSEQQCIVFLENNRIYNCKSYDAGGGIAISQYSHVEFSQTHRNSVYSNYAPYGKDIAFSNPSYNYQVYLDKGTRLLNAQDQFYIYEYYPLVYPDVDISVSILRGVESLNVCQDLYVAPWGNDQNDGLSPQNPLKTIDYATRIIHPDEDNPLTIHLAEGTYSRSLNQQEYPFALKPWTSLVGAGMNSTILDDENVYRIMSVIVPEANVLFQDFAITRVGNDIYSATALGSKTKKNITKNILLYNNKSYYSVAISNTNQLFMKNIIIKDGTSISNSYSFDSYVVNEMLINNIISDNMHATHPQGGGVGFTMQETVNLRMNNVSLTNSSAFNPSLFCLYNWPSDNNEEVTPGLVVINNVLIANNNTSPGDWDLAKIHISDYYNQVILNNWTIANNRGNNKVMSVSGIGCEMNNMIFYNPEIPIELWLEGVDGYVAATYLNNSLLYGGYDKIHFENDSCFLEMQESIYTAPLFAHEYVGSNENALPEYFKLSANSPCINAGIQDTTGTYISATDLGNHQRIWDGRIDMGCFEYGAPLTSDEQTVPLGMDYQLSSAPNPVIVSSFPYTTISFNYPEKARTEPEIEIFNVKGQKVKTLKTGLSFRENAIMAKVSKEALSNIKGHYYSVIWDTRDNNNKQVASGVYFIRAKVDGRVIQTQKMMVIK